LLSDDDIVVAGNFGLVRYLPRWAGCLVWVIRL